MGLGTWAERTERVGVLLLGAAAGLAVVATFGVPSGGGILAGAGVAALVGFVGGESLQRWVPLVLLALVASGFALRG